MTKKRVVITGIGMLSPLANNTEDSWKAALAGKSGIAPTTRFDASAFTSRISGEVKGFNAEDWIEKKEIKKIDIFSQYALAASQMAWDDAGLTKETYEPSKIGSILGVGIGGLTSLEKYHKAYLEGGPRKISPFLIPAMISNLGSGNIAIRYGLQGVNFVISSACTSSTHAIGESYRMIANGIQDAVLTGGAESTVSPVAIGGFCSMKALSTRNETPEIASRPFDKGRDGFVLSEGSIVLVLESLDAAKARGAKIYAEVSGYGVSCDANHITSPCADGAGAIACMNNAISDAGLNPSEIQYVNAHGTSTPVGDAAETFAIKGVFKEYAKSGLLVSSTKSMTGHLLGAAGAIEAGFCALALRDQVIPPTINLDDPDEACDLDYVSEGARKTALTHVMSNSFGFGGTNASVVLSKVE